MSKRPFDTLQPKITRNDRFAQMSHQEKIIEQKKREILAKLDAKQKQTNTEPKEKSSSSTSSNSRTPSKSPTNTKPDTKKSSVSNIFSNDGSFLDQFKQLKEKKNESKRKPFGKNKDHYSSQDKNYGDKSRWTSRRRSPSPKSRRPSRFSHDKSPYYEPKITINTTFSSQNFSILEQQTQSQSPSISQPLTPQPHFTTSATPLMKNIIPPPTVTYTSTIVAPPQQVTPECEPVISASQVLLNVPPPQLVQGTISSIVLAPQTQNVLVTTPVLTTVTLPPPIGQNIAVAPPAALPVPPPCLPTVELASIPPPNPIQIQNIPQPEPINTLNIPPPAPLQVHTIPTPTSLQLDEIPNPKPLDLLAIPTPNEGKGMSDPDFIKNIPPPNKSVPPPIIPGDLPPQNTTLVQLPPPTNQIAPSQPQNILIHTVTPSVSQPNSFSINIIQSNPTSQIPSLMAQPILPPPGMHVGGSGLNLGNANVSNLSLGASNLNLGAGNVNMGVANVNLGGGGVNIPNVSIGGPNMNVGGSIVSMGGANLNIRGGNVNISNMGMNVSCPPPLLPQISVSQPPPAFVTQPPPITSQMPPMNVPPPVVGSPFRDVNAVFPTGTPDFEAMLSLARMVAECGPGVERVVKEKKNRDPNLWFLFQKESAAYAQYQALIEKCQREKAESEVKPDPEDMYEPEMALEDDLTSDIKQELTDNDYEFNAMKRKRRSRWGEKEANVPPPQMLLPPANVIPPLMPPGITPMLSKITQNDPGLIQYTLKTYGSTNLSDEDWKKAEDNYKIHLLYQDMVKKREELKKLEAQGRNKYEYDSDEDTDGGTWEHRLREKEMLATELWATELTKQAEGKHHIGDFLPPEELQRFMEKSNAVKEGRQPNFSDYKEFKIKEDNIGFKMLQKLGWNEGQGLGSNSSGIVEPINKGAPREHTQGLGLNLNDATEGEDEYESYRKRMMLAYRFRPNPLNNPRRPYY